MEKIRVTVKIAGKEYNIAGYDSKEHVERVARQVDRKMAELQQATNLPPAQLAVLTAVNAVDDAIKSRDQLRLLEKENQRLKALIENHDAQA